VNSDVVLTTGLTVPTWASTGASTGYYVMEFDDSTTATSTQRTKGTFLANADGSTGVAARDAYRWGPADRRSTLFPDATYTTRYRRQAAVSDDTGEPLSVHKLADLQGWANSALSYHCARVLINQNFPSPVIYQAPPTTFVHKAGPFFAPLYGGARPLLARVRAYIANGATTGVVRVTCSTSPPRTRTTLTPPRYTDGGSAYGEITFTGGTAEWSDEVEIRPNVVPGTPCFCWITLEQKVDGAAGRIIVSGLMVREAPL
jgi:hypothetical protein